MKYNQMQEICNKMQAPNMNGCCRCPLHNKNVEGGCLKNYRAETEEKYRQAKEEKNDILANKIMKDYQEIERSVLNT